MRISPLKLQTIPRLELLSAVLLSRLLKNVSTCLTTLLRLEEPRCFTDSQVALFWIKGVEKEWKPFVQHRVEEIRRLTSVHCWSHCAGKNNPAGIPSRGLLSAQDLSEAEIMWIKENQSTLVLNENFPTWKVQFGLFKDKSGLWRCGGRLQNADLPFSAKHPVLLDRKHHLTQLIINEAHQGVQHNGVKETLTEVRSKYWIVGGRSLVRSHIHQCVICRQFEGRPLCGPPALPFPAFRVDEAPPFTNTAVDFAGPLYIRNKGVFVSIHVLCY